MRVLIRYCGGNFHSLEHVFTFLLETHIDYISSLKDAINSVLAGLPIPLLDEKVVKAALLGDAVSTIDNQPISKWISRGQLINTTTGDCTIEFDSKTKIIPLLNILQLKKWIMQDDSPLSIKVKFLFEIDHDYILTGHGFEEFHADWELVWREIAGSRLPKYCKKEFVVFAFFLLFF